MAPGLTVLIVDDHPLFVDGLRSLLTAHGVQVSGTARDGFEALDRARELRPDLVLMDIQMPRANGLAALRLIKAELPAIKVVMLTMSADDDLLFQAIRGGASGYLLKTQDTDAFFRLLEDVAHGEVVLSPGLAARILSEFRRRDVSAPHDLTLATERRGLSPRELQVLTLVAQALTYKEAGAKLFLSERTIKYHVAQIVDRLHVASRAEAIEYAKRAGLV